MAISRVAACRFSASQWTRTAVFGTSGAVGGFVCSFDEPTVKLPAKVSRGTVAVERDGVLVVDVEAQPDQISLLRRDPTNN